MKSRSNSPRPARTAPPAAPGGEPHVADALALVADHHLEQRVASGDAARAPPRRPPRTAGPGGRARRGRRPGRGRAAPRTRVAGHVRAQDERVHEEADEVARGLLGAPGDGAAERDVVVSARPVQQRGYGGLAHHEHAGVRVARDLRRRRVRPGGRSAVNVPPRCPTVPGRARSTGSGISPGGRRGSGPSGRAAGRGRCRGRAGRRAAPAATARGRRTGRAAAPRPGPPVQPGGVSLGDVAGERPERPFVERDVVEHGEQQMFALTLGEHGDPQRDVLGEVERPGDHVRGRAGGDLQDGTRLFRVENPLVGGAVVLGEDRPEAFVPRGDVPDRRFHRREVEVTAQVHGERQMVAPRGPSSSRSSWSSSHSRRCADDSGMRSGLSFGSRTAGAPRPRCGARVPRAPRPSAPRTGRGSPARRPARPARGRPAASRAASARRGRRSRRRCLRPARPGPRRTACTAAARRVWGARPALRGPSWPGSGRARRSSLPLTVSGSASRVMIALGTM